MPCKKCSNGKWKFGSSKCMYTSLEACNRAAAAYYASHPGEKEKDDNTEHTSTDYNKKDIQSSD